MLIELDNNIPIAEFARAMIGIGCEIRSGNILVENDDTTMTVTLRVTRIRRRKTKEEPHA